MTKNISICAKLMISIKIIEYMKTKINENKKLKTFCP